MKNRKRKWAGLFMALACLLTLLTASPVLADINADAEAQLEQSVSDYLNQIFLLDDDIYDQLVESGGFYEIMVDAIRENRDTVGAFQSVGDIKTEVSSSAVTCTAEVVFENYDAEVVMTFDATGQAPQNFVMNIDYPLSVKMGQAGMNTLTGVLVVFVILLFLAGVISLFGLINKGAKKEPAKASQPAPAPKAAPAPAAEQAADPAQDADDLELAIVLAAAIAAAEEEQPSGDGYVVRSIKKVNTTRRWKRA